MAYLVVKYDIMKSMVLPARDNCIYCVIYSKSEISV